MTPPSPKTDPRAFLNHLFINAVAEADPMQVIPKHLPTRPEGRRLVIGAGKASARMAEGAFMDFTTREID